MPCSEEDIYIDNDLENRNSLSFKNTTKASTKDKNFNYIEQKQTNKENMENDPNVSVDKVEERSDEDMDEDEKDNSLEIISDKVVLLMMSTGGVSDKYTPAVSSMQEGKVSFRPLLLNHKNFLLILFSWMILRCKYFYFLF